MKSIKSIFAKVSVSIVTLLTAVMLFSSSASAITIPYSGETTPPADAPAFNVYTGVPGIGNESDFVRIKKDGEANSAYRNSVDTECKTGDKFTVWFYVHNGANQDMNNNGTGPSVAKDVKAKVELPQSTGSNFSIKGLISSSNAGNLSDTASINCGNKQFTMSYVDGSASAYLDLPNKDVKLPKALFEAGTPIGTNDLDGNVWGCWEQRVWIGLDVVVTEKETPPPVAPVYTCDLIRFENAGDRKRNIRVNYTAKDGATFKNWDLSITSLTDNKVLLSEKGLSVDRNPYLYDFVKDGNYKAVATINFDVKGETKSITCETSEEIKTPVTIVRTSTTPTKLPDTGAGNIIGLLVGIAALVATAHFLITKKLAKNKA